MKKKQTLPDLETIRAAREAIHQEKRRRKADEVTHIVTGVPRAGDGIDWPRWTPPKPKPPPRPTTKPQPVASEPPAMPTEWHYCWVQTRAPTGNDPGSIIEGQYAVAEGVLYLEDMQGNAIASQKLRADDNAAGVARRLLRDRRRGSSAVPGFYDGLSYNPGRYFH